MMLSQPSCGRNKIWNLWGQRMNSVTHCFCRILILLQQKIHFSDKMVFSSLRFSSLIFLFKWHPVGSFVINLLSCYYMNCHWDDKRILWPPFCIMGISLTWKYHLCIEICALLSAAVCAIPAYQHWENQPTWQPARCNFKAVYLRWLSLGLTSWL